MKLTSTTVLSLLICILCTCSKEEKFIPLNEQYLKDVKVEGAEKVTLDNNQNFIQVVLPENYSRDVIDLDFTVYDGYELQAYSTLPNTPKSNPTNKMTIEFKGMLPVRVTVLRKKNSTFRNYPVYVEQLGPLKVSMAADTLCVLRHDTANSIAYVYSPTQIISGIGTIPGSPNAAYPVITITDTLTKIKLTGEFRGFAFPMKTDTSVLPLKNLIVQLLYQGKSFTFPGKKQLSMNSKDCNLVLDGRIITRKN